MRPILSPLLVAVCLASCASAEHPLPTNAHVTAPIAWRASAVASEGVDPAWWDTFGDPNLRQNVELALANNVDISVAETRVREAEALFAQARSALFPTINASIGGQDSRALNPVGQANDLATAQPQLQIAYEVDAWDRLRNSSLAARQAVQASRYGRDAVALSVAAATARAYIALTSLDAQLTVARETLEARDEALRLANRRADNGVTSRLELTQAQAERENAAQRVPALELAVKRQENGMRLLTGQTPGPVTRGRLIALTLPAIGPGLPSQLLARRPDIAQAEAQMRASDASLGAAQAALLPQVQLTGSAGALFIERLDPVSIWSLGGSILAPLFNAGRLAGQVDAAAARRDAAAYAYRQTALNAFAEAENALEGVVDIARQRESAERQRDAVAEALRHASNRYSSGYASYLEQLDAQRGLLNAELAVVQLREAQLSNAVSLYQALGGGWQRAVTQPAITR